MYLTAGSIYISSKPTCTSLSSFGGEIDPSDGEGSAGVDTDELGRSGPDDGGGARRD
jgi:hypothetical protein